MKKTTNSLFAFAMLIAMCSNLSAQNWKTNGNASMNADFLGTTNLQDLRIRTNNTQKAIITTSGNMGLGTSTPAAKLDVIGTIKISDGTEGAGKVLTSNASGVASWQTLAAPAVGWSLTGNAGTVDGTNFIGTTDNISLSFRVNNVLSGKIDPNLLNTFLGYHSGNTTTTGNINTGNGMYALSSNTIGYYNTAIGGSALYLNTEGYANTATGMQSMRNNITGFGNTANGQNSLFGNVTGIYNTAIGSSALESSTSGQYNTAVGNGALFSSITGSSNTAIGFAADVTSSNLTNATAIGANATVSTSNSMVLGNGVNVGIGISSPASKLDVRGNTSIIGNFTNNDPFSNAFGVVGSCNNISGAGTGVVGNGGTVGVYGSATLSGAGLHTGVQGNAQDGGVFNYGGHFVGGGGANTFGVYSSATGNTNAYGIFSTASGGGTFWAGYFAGSVFASGVYTSSDRKLKKDIQPLNGALSIIDQLHPSEYSFKTNEYKSMNLPEGLQYGLIADEVQTVLPGAVKKAVQPAEYENNDAQNGKKLSEEVEFNAVNYTVMVPILIAAMKEQQAMIESLSAKVELLMGKNDNGSELGATDGQSQSKYLLGNSSTFLSQNSPNPFNQSSAITCYLQEGITNGHILLYNGSGIMVKDFTLSNQGMNQVTIDAGTLQPGFYTYSLIINGKCFDTKKMTVTR